MSDTPIDDAFFSIGQEQESHQSYKSNKKTYNCSIGMDFKTLRTSIAYSLQKVLHVFAIAAVNERRRWAASTTASIINPHRG